MKQESVLAHAPCILTEAQRTAFFQTGYLALPNYVPAHWLKRLDAGMSELVDKSRTLEQSDGRFVLEEGHTAASPRLHRVMNPQDQSSVFWEFFTDRIMTDLAADLVGPDVKFHHAKLNCKAGRSTQGYAWHQDIAGWPHTDFSPVTVGIYLEGCDQDQGPLAVVPGSQEGPMYSLYDDAGEFAGKIADGQLGFLKENRIDTVTGSPGTTVVIHCRVVHGSAINTSERGRPLLLPVYSSADSYPYGSPGSYGEHMGDIVRGRPARYACFDTRPVEVTPDWRGKAFWWRTRKSHADSEGQKNDPPKPISGAAVGA